MWSCAAGFFKAYRGNVSLPNGYTLERWSPTPGNNHSIFFEPTTCKPKRSLAPPRTALAHRRLLVAGTPVSEVGLGFGSLPYSGVTYFDVQKIKPDPKVFEVPSFCPK